MRSLFISIIFLAALSGCSASPKCSSPDAVGIVATLRPDDQFRAMLTMLVKRTQTAAMTTKRDGPAANQNLSKAIDAAVERHRGEWRRNLVASWSILSPSELQQVCAAIGKRDQAVFKKFAERVGGDVQSRNEPVLKQASAEVLDQLWSNRE